jgi:hypothetical protein
VTTLRSMSRLVERKSHRPPQRDGVWYRLYLVTGDESGDAIFIASRGMPVRQVLTVYAHSSLDNCTDWVKDPKF